MAAIVDMTGKVFGRLTVREYVARQGWRCECACGNAKIAHSNRLRGGQVRSCGCLQRELWVAKSLKHGHSRQGAISTTYNIWRGMIKRCEDPKINGYENYGGRGITVCERWHTFENFLADMGERPKGLTLDRKETNGNYELGNCRWATEEEQRNNKRTSRFLTYDGRAQTVAMWARETGINENTLLARLSHGWTVDKALSSPTRPHKIPIASM